MNVAGCAQVMIATPTPINLTIAGATAMQPVLYELTTEFTRQHPNVRFDLRGGGSTLGEERLLAGQIDLAAFLAALPPGLPLALEVPMTALTRRIGPAAVLAQVARATRAWLARVGG